MEPYPYDTHNVYHDPAYAEVVSELKTELNRLRSEIGDATQTILNSSPCERLSLS